MSDSRPSNLQAGAGGNEVQSVAVSATEGLIVLLDPETGEPAFAAAGGSAAELKGALEAVYGAGNVEVTGGPSDEAASKPYLVTFQGALAERRVEPMTANNFFVGCGQTEEEVAAHPLCKAQETVSELRAGRPDGEIVLTASNLGNRAIEGEASPVTIAAHLPNGLRAVGIEGVAGNATTSLGAVDCSVKTLTCTFAGMLPSYKLIEVRVAVAVQPGAQSGELDTASVTGGNAPPASVSRPIAIGAGTPFGVADYEMSAEEEGGEPDTQAGSHPYQLTTTLTWNQTLNAEGEAIPAALARNASFELPPGLIGNPTPIARCPIGQFLRFTGEQQLNGCEPDTAVGAAIISINEPKLGSNVYSFTVPVFNLEPAVGEPARFGFLLPGTPVMLDTSVRTGGDYGVTVTTKNISQTSGFLKSEVVFWGVPGDASHDGARGNACLKVAGAERLPCQPGEAHNPPPLLAMPTSCGGPLHTTMQAISWLETNPAPVHSEATLPEMNGCNRLPFAPSIAVSPDGQAASTATGLQVDVHVPQEESLNPHGLAESEVRDTTVVLPAGVALNPSAADGLEGCTEAQIGYIPSESSPPEDLRFTSTLPKPLEPGRNFCPDASKIATVKIATPLLPNPLEGAVYLATPAPLGAREPGNNPFDALIAMYIVAEDPVSGSLVKLAGTVSLDPGTGQITSTFANTPQLPFEELQLHFFGGDRSPLVTPPTPNGCPAPYVTQAAFAPWSGNPSENVLSPPFEITSGPNGSPCTGTPFAPTLTAGTTNVQAGAFTPLTTTVNRDDGQQPIQGVQVHMPPGLSGLLSSVKLCPEPQADEGTCGPESLIGETTVSVGVGGDPFSVKGGRVYITGPYDGAPYGLSIVNPAKAGPFDLARDTGCDCVLVRARVEVDRRTAALTVTTDGEGPGRHPIPHILDGIPLQIKHVNVTIDRPGFVFNPTSCDASAISSTLASAEGANAPLGVPFQVTDCASLAFKPSFQAATGGRASRLNGTSLNVKLTYPAGSLGHESNIAGVKVSLPKALPSRLGTLQKACTAAQFAGNPAGCPAASIVGHAKVATPVLPVPLEGPAYFVSRGGEAFPNLVIVLQGYGVTVELVGDTLIKNGVTSSTFKATPDVPFSSFELNLPAGPFSALTAIGDLCKQALSMPTELIAQDGASLSQGTPVQVRGCPTNFAISAHRVRGRTLTLAIRVPGAGTVKASGRGLGAASKSSRAREMLTLELHQRRAGRLRTRVLVTYTPSAGRARKKQTRSVTVTFKR